MRWTFRPARSQRDAVAVLVAFRFDFGDSASDHERPRVAASMELLEAEPLPEPASPIDTLPEGVKIAPPRVIRSVMPRYTDAAMGRRLQGHTRLQIVILPDGTVGAARIVKSLDATYGLDREALIAARYWLFTPSRHNGVPVATTAELDLSFSIW